MKSRSVHLIYPNFGPDHLIGPAHPYPHGLKCWCQPTLATPCQQCPDGEINRSCWACGGIGVVPVAFDDGQIPLLVIHYTEEKANGRS